MSEDARYLLPSTPEASAAVAQSRGEALSGAPSPGVAISYPGEGTDFQIGSGVYRAVNAKPYERKIEDPIYRPLRIFALDPSVSRLEGAVALVNVPYEPLKPGPVGTLFHVDNYDGARNVRYRQADLEAPEVLIRNGRDPSPSDPMFHQQMVYAVCSLVYAAFQKALGRDIAWGFDARPGEDQPRLLLRPHAFCGQNAYYDEEHGELSFGYYRAEQKVAGMNLPRGFVFTCLSHDVIVHEVTHALLDGLRTRFTYPSGPDAPAFHEAFADLVAILQHFSYDQVVQAAVRKSRGKLEEAELLTDIARQFGHTTGTNQALRTAIDVTDPSEMPKPYYPESEAHELGSVLVSGIFEAFTTVFKRKTARYIRLATNGTGILPMGELPADLQSVLAEEASQLASQFLAMCVRAIDYCPPVDIEFGEFLRAVITADYDLVPDDPWGYREAWIDAFRRRSIYPRHVSSLSEDALLWSPPSRPVPCIQELSFAKLAFEGDPGCPAGVPELRRQACALGRVISQPEHLEVFGFAQPDDPRLDGDTVAPPCVESIRSSRRIGPDGQIAFDLVAEVVQSRTVRAQNGQAAWDFFGGATVILGPHGEIRYVISKSVLNRERLEHQRQFMSSENGRRYWKTVNGKHRPEPHLFQLLHHSKRGRSAAG